MRPLLHKFGLGSGALGSGSAGNGGRDAFTVAELLIVVMIMSILAAAAAPTFLDSLLFHRVESAARRLKADLELARHTARHTSATQSVNFSGSGYTLSAGIKDMDNPTSTYRVDFGAAPYELESVVADFNGAIIVSFNGYGAPSSGGTMVLTCKGHECTLTLNAVTGDVTIASVHSGGGAAATDGN